MILDYIQQYKGATARLAECMEALSTIPTGSYDTLYWTGEYLTALMNAADAVVMMRNWFDRTAYADDDRRKLARAHNLPENIGIRGLGVQP